jgi:PadR family transcriptional regulator, regulatory protein PadR
MARLSRESGASSNELLHGTLESMVLRVLADSPEHGYGLGRRIEQALGDAMTIEDGSLYPALYRLERRGLIKGSWGVSDTGRRARFYELTPAGRKALGARRRQWAAFAKAVTALLGGNAS